MYLAIQLNRKTTGHFTASYGNKPEDWNNTAMLDILGWHNVDSGNSFYPTDGVFPEETLEIVRRQLGSLTTKNPNYIFRVFLVRDDGVRLGVTTPVCGHHTQGVVIETLSFGEDVPVSEPALIEGEEEEEFLLYRGSS
jgi:hypothetical protein